MSAPKPYPAHSNISACSGKFGITHFNYCDTYFFLSAGWTMSGNSLRRLRHFSSMSRISLFWTTPAAVFTSKSFCGSLILKLVYLTRADISSNFSYPSSGWWSIIRLNTSMRCEYKSVLMGIPRSFAYLSSFLSFSRVSNPTLIYFYFEFQKNNTIQSLKHIT